MSVFLFLSFILKITLDYPIEIERYTLSYPHIYINIIGECIIMNLTERFYDGTLRIKYKETLLRWLINHYLYLKEAYTIPEDTYTIISEGVTHHFDATLDLNDEPIVNVTVEYADGREPLDATLPLSVEYLVRNIKGVSNYFTTTQFSKHYIEYIKYLFEVRQRNYPIKNTDWIAVVKYEYLSPRDITFGIQDNPGVITFSIKDEQDRLLDPNEFLNSVYIEYYEESLKHTLTLNNITKEELETPVEITLETNEMIYQLQYRYLYGLVLQYMMMRMRTTLIYKQYPDLFPPEKIIEIAYQIAHRHPEYLALEDTLIEIIDRIEHEAKIPFISVDFLKFYREVAIKGTEEALFPTKQVVEQDITFGWQFSVRSQIDPECSFIELHIEGKDFSERITLNQLELYSHHYSHFDHFLPYLEDVSLRERLYEIFRGYLSNSTIVHSANNAPIDPMYVGPNLAYLWIFFKQKTQSI